MIKLFIYLFLNNFLKYDIKQWLNIYLLNYEKNDLENNYCMKFKCFSQANMCVYKDKDEKIINYNNCKDDYYCKILEDGNGLCNIKLIINKPNYLLPGDICTEEKEDKCVYGKQICNNGICLGNKKNESCILNSDCEIGFYCGNLVCKILKKDGKKCYNDDECEIKSICKLNNLYSGKCTKLFSIKINKRNSSVSSININNLINIKYDLLCENGILNNGYCSKGDISPNGFKGKECKLKYDCNGINGTYSNCSCGLNLDGKKYCDLFKGDIEYTNYINSYKTFLDSINPIKCHKFKNIKKCGNYKLFKDYKCNYLKYKYYNQINNLESFPCLKKKHYTEITFLKEYYLYCNKFKEILFYIQFIIIILIK